MASYTLTWAPRGPPPGGSVLRPPLLLGRKMTGGFIEYWEHVVTQRDSPGFDFAQKMVGLPKVVFSKTLQHVEGKNVRVENGDLVDAVKQLKSRPGKDIVVYGGATFVSSLIEHGLVDEMNLFVNPVAIGSGMRVFKGKTTPEAGGLHGLLVRHRGEQLPAHVARLVGTAEVNQQTTSSSATPGPSSSGPTCRRSRLVRPAMWGSDVAAILEQAPDLRRAPALRDGPSQEREPVGPPQTLA